MVAGGTEAYIDHSFEAGHSRHRHTEMRMDGWMDGMDGIHGTDGWMDGMDGEMDGRDGWTGCVDGGVERWMEGWKEGVRG